MVSNLFDNLPFRHTSSLENARHLEPKCRQLQQARRIHLVPRPRARKIPASVMKEIEDKYDQSHEEQPAEVCAIFHFELIRARLQRRRFSWLPRFLQ